jgi:Ca2+-binding EF-hand superfamily protein
MPHPGRALASFAAFTLGLASVAAQDGGKKDMSAFEEKTVARAAERALRSADGERGRWLKALHKAYSGRVPEVATADDLGRWFDLLADGGREWRRADGPTGELFDRVAERLELGPVPSIRRDEFLQFARKHLAPADPGKGGDPFAEADKAFRILDRDGSGELEPAEWTEKLRAAARTADADANGRISRDEYRAYFADRVRAAAEAGPSNGKQAQQGAAGGPPGKGVKDPNALPEWWTELDTDKDGQVGLYEWRMAGRPVAEFREMDLDHDGLLTPAEYRQYVKLRAAAEAAAAAERADTTPAPPEMRAGEKKR